jgi:hypothetical protein
MRTAIALALSMPLTACVVGPKTGGDGSGDEGIFGSVSSSTEWAGEILISGMTTIEPGVTVTVAAGTTITLKDVASIIVGGVLEAQGTDAGKVVLQPESTAPGASFRGVTVSPGGEVMYTFVEQSGGGLFLNGTAKATIVDTHMWKANGDFLMMNGGTLDVSYSWVGVEVGDSDTTHCNMHFGGSGNVIKVNHTNISAAPYGLMFYGGMTADFKSNNWFGNTVDVDVTTTSPVTGDFSSGWFEKGAPAGSGLAANTLSGTRMPACDGTNDATCAGPRG